VVEKRRGDTNYLGFDPGSEQSATSARSWPIRSRCRLERLTTWLDSSMSQILEDAKTKVDDTVDALKSGLRGGGRPGTARPGAALSGDQREKPCCGIASPR
jgi:hypothetical protein